MNGKENGAGIL